jgi:hypothetical protein
MNKEPSCEAVLQYALLWRASRFLASGMTPRI